VVAGQPALGVVWLDDVALGQVTYAVVRREDVIKSTVGNPPAPGNRAPAVAQAPDIGEFSDTEKWNALSSGQTNTSESNPQDLYQIIGVGPLAIAAGASDTIAVALVAQRSLLDARILPQLAIVILHNAAGLLLGFLCALAFRVAERDRRAIVIEGGMQNSGLALGIIAVTFNADLGMVIIASLWGIWHIVSGLTLAILWRMKDARLAR
jgi:hypothetical protein